MKSSLLPKITVFELNEFFYPTKITRYTEAKLLSAIHTDQSMDIRITPVLINMQIPYRSST